MNTLPYYIESPPSHAPKGKASLEEQRGHTPIHTKTNVLQHLQANPVKLSVDVNTM